ncbi:MAG: hypothetical protein CMH54_03675 [Myxococcales bacterium]|nr:hypothetical protein [Myxococcales bacterium]
MLDNRLIIDPGVGAGGLDAPQVQLSEDRLHHIGRVLRLNESECFWLGDGKGSIRSVRVVSAYKGKVELTWNGAKQIVPPPECPVHLVMALLQGRDLETAVVAAVEAGADQIHLVSTDRVNRPRFVDDDSTAKRLEKAVVEASSQAGRPIMPDVHYAEELDVAMRAGSRRFYADLCDPNAATSETTELADSYVIAIGPEGGWSEREGQVFDTVGAEKLWLGPAVLRARTAAAVAVHRMVLLRVAYGGP